VVFEDKNEFRKLLKIKKLKALAFKFYINYLRISCERDLQHGI